MPNTSHATANSKGDTVLTMGTATLRSMRTACHRYGRKSITDGISATRGGIYLRRMISAMSIYIFLALLIALAVLAPFFGADSRFDRDDHGLHA